MHHFLPHEIVGELDRFIVGQNKAKRCVAIALRNRWRRQQIENFMREEILPKNILMVGPTGCGKTEIARRLARLIKAPFLKIEATKFTEIGYVGRDVDQIIRDLLDKAIDIVRNEQMEKIHAQADLMAEERVLDVLVGKNATSSTREQFRNDLRAGKLDEHEIELELDDTPSQTLPTFDIPGMPGAQMGMLNLGDMLGKTFGERKRQCKMKIGESHHILVEQESEKLIDQNKITRMAIDLCENNGIVFLDEFDKICVSSSHAGRGEVSREGVQRDLLPLIEGTSVSTRHGQVRTDHILFIASGSFHLSKPSDLLPELQGRLPIRVKLDSLNRDDFERILCVPENSLPKQYQALFEVEKIKLVFKKEAITKIADIAYQLNNHVENIGARRLHALMEELLEEFSFKASELSNTTISIDKKTVHEKLSGMLEDQNLDKYII
ncbi:MAG: ATP-dependent protease ATPase subunit HslU [Pseudomonadota bacterium]